jgi:RHS repeat-associated protein
MDDSKRIATVREGYDFGDSTPTVKYNLDDHLGSSNVSVDDTGALVSFEEYYPFGETSFGSFGKKRYRFCGKEKDVESGLYYYGARYYSPWTCRFVSVDPKSLKYVHQSPFVYADNNPIGKLDHNGEGTIAEDDVIAEANQSQVPNEPSTEISTNGNDKSKKEAKENVVGIAAYKKGGEAGTFNSRIKSLKPDQTFSVNNGKEFVNALVEASKKGPITKLYIASHSSGTAIYMDSNEGLYNDKTDAYINSFYDHGNWSMDKPGANSATLQDTTQKIKSGEIVFAENAEIVFLGCNAANYPGIGFDSIAENFSEMLPTAYVTGATGKTSPVNKVNSKGKLNETGFYSTETDTWKTFRDGSLFKKTEIKEFNPKTFNPQIK